MQTNYSTRRKSATLLCDYDRVGGDSYYRVPYYKTSSSRHLTRRSNGADFSKQTNDTHRDFSKYRYEDEMREPEDTTGAVRPNTLYQRRVVRLPGQRRGAQKWRLPD